MVRFINRGGIINTNLWLKIDFGCQTMGHLKKMMGVLYVVAVFKLRFVFLDVFIHNKCSYTEMKNIVGIICCNAPFLGRCYLLSI